MNRQGLFQCLATGVARTWPANFKHALAFTPGSQRLLGVAEVTSAVSSSISARRYVR